MEYDQLIVGGKPQIALDPRAELKRGTECSQRIFRDGRAEMQPAVGEPPRPGGEGVRP